MTIIDMSQWKKDRGQKKNDTALDYIRVASSRLEDAILVFCKETGMGKHGQSVSNSVEGINYKLKFFENWEDINDEEY